MDAHISSLAFVMLFILNRLARWLGVYFDSESGSDESEIDFRSAVFDDCSVLFKTDLSVVEIHRVQTKKC